MKTTISPEVQQMIQNRETELQRAYDNCISQRCEILDWMDEYKKQLYAKREELNGIDLIIEKCIHKANEYSINLKMNIK